MSLRTGTAIGPYEIVSLLGAGGMGEVYRARDTRLKREVALKVLPTALAADPERLARLQREAEVLASLNHPHVAQIYGIEDAPAALDSAQAGEGAPHVHALVMELVEGPTLADRIGEGALPLEEAILLATQIAEALDAAHEIGVVHRDLKPANIKVRPDGAVKVLDFGLAKALQPEASSAGVSQSPTITTPAMTERGVILGSAAYMAPEQAKGRPVDKRADVWAFGAVLFEMLTARRCFPGEDVSDTFAAVLRAEPDWSALPARTPPALARLLRRCLDKDRRSRLSDMAMARLELRDATTELSAPAAATPIVAASRTPLRRLAPYAATAVVALLTGFAVWTAGRPAAPPSPVMRFSIELADLAQFSNTGRTVVALSPDGTNLVYAANERLFQRPLAELEATAIPGTTSARAPFFSADGRWIGYWQERQLRKIAVSGGPPVTICDLSRMGIPSGATWGTDDTILLGGGGGGVWRVRAAGGMPEQVVRMNDGEWAHGPQMLPGGWILFTLIPAGATLEQGQVVVQLPATGERRVLIDGARDARYVSSGHIVFGRGNTLLAQAFDEAALTVLGGAVPMVEGVANSNDNAPAMHFAVSETGTLVYAPTFAVESLATTLVQATRNGTRSLLAEVDGAIWFPRVSPDGSRVAYGVSSGEALGTPSDLWVVELARRARTRVTFAGNNRFYPIWTPDSTRLTFADGSAATNRLQWVLADGSSAPETLIEVGPRRFPTSWSPDGRTLALYTTGPSGTRDLWMLQVDGAQRTPAPFVETAFEERGAIFSPDGRWIVYVSNKSGQNDIYARPFPGPGGEVTVSVGGGQEPVWAPSGRELFYRHEGKMMAVRIDASGPSLVVSPPVTLFNDPYRLDIGGAAGGVANYDISPDGRYFVMVEEPAAASARPLQPMHLVAVLNWFEDLTQRAPTTVVR